MGCALISRDLAEQHNGATGLDALSWTLAEKLLDVALYGKDEPRAALAISHI